MKKLSRSLFSLALLAGILILAASCRKDHDEDTPQTNIIAQKLQTLVNTSLADYKIKYPDFPGGIAMEVISKQGTFFVSAGMGNVTNQAHFRAASNTKTLTATAILLLYQQGKLDINKKLTDTIPGTQDPYLPSTAEYNIPYKSSITILDLLRHRAGIFDVSNDNIPDTVSVQVPYKGQNYIDFVLAQDPVHTFTFDELVGAVSACRLFYFPPNTAYHYSNTGYSILGKIIERVSQTTYQQYLVENVMTPMGMSHSTMPVTGTDQTIPAPFASGYILLPDTLVDVTLSNMSANVAEGTLITTPDDLAHFLRRLITGNGALTAHMVNTVMLDCLSTSPANAGTYGCGIGYTNNLGYGHTGAHAGYLSEMAHDPASGFTVVVFTNCWNEKAQMTSLIDEMTP
jgi:D-alanyl-D-alanine carboxypeptidase